MLTSEQREDVRRAVACDGYAILRNIVPRPRMQQLRDELHAEFGRARASGELFSGGGTISGHLNCFPGAQSRFVYDTLQEREVIGLVRQISPQATRMPNIGCNFNLPGSSAQNNHIDGYASTAFMIVNVAVVDTTVRNGALELTPGSHLKEYRYHEFVLARRPARRIEMNVGDVLIRSSALWHRGMPNKSHAVRPMLGFTWEEGGSELEDSYTVHDGKIRFLPNRYTLDLAGRVRERAFAALPALGSSYLFVRSLLS
ncbi:MAG: hypothetical protein RLZZ450_2924 [Pseudomonadota bacterium]|jgi:ectoine hydroxylase-related dioxygenase (phytanoyl-CoA dioxygenase family)